MRFTNPNEVITENLSEAEKQTKLLKQIKASIVNIEGFIKIVSVLLIIEFGFLAYWIMKLYSVFK